ncbi:tetratricopeptide repeat protein [candidate division KSB1 bacterium]|nr:tetratricopeptide repeat protein [candidate division KSB1 bacterium]
MERKRIFTTATFVVAAAGYGFCLLPKNAIGQEASADSALYSMFEKTLDNSHRERFREAISIAMKIRGKYPEEPAGAFGLLATYQTISRNYRVKLYESQIDSLLDLSIELAEEAVKRDKKNGIGYFYLGSAYGMRCIHNASQRDWFAALRDGSNVSESFERAIRYNPKFYDSYYGLGLYKYWLGAKSKILRILPFSKDKRHEGIKHIKLAIEKGRFLNVDAMYGLSAAYFNEGEYEQALEITDRLYEEYPYNPTLLYRRGRIFQALERWQSAKVSFEKLYDILKNAEFQSVSYQVDCLYQIAKCDFNLGNYLQAQQCCEEAISMEEHCDFSKEREGPLEEFSEIKDGLHELNKNAEAQMLTEAKTSPGE